METLPHKTPNRLVGLLGRAILYTAVAGLMLFGAGYGLTTFGMIEVGQYLAAMPALFIGMGVAGLFGAVSGWHHAAVERTRMKALVTERNQAVVQNLALVESVAPDVSPAKFAKQLASRDSYADAVQADRAGRTEVPAEPVR